MRIIVATRTVMHSRRNRHIRRSANAQAQVWVLHNFDSPVASAAGAAYRSRVLLTEIDCAGGRWTLWHAALYTDHFALGRRLSAEDFSPSEADYRPAAPGAAMDKVRIVACR